MSSLKESVAQFFRDLIPTRVVTKFDVRSMTQALAHTLTVDDVHNIFREAEAGDCTRLFALYRDIILANAHLQGRFADRKRAVLGDTLNLQPFAKKNAADLAAVEAVWPITRHPDWFDALNHLLDAALWPVAVVEKVYKPTGHHLPRTYGEDIAQLSAPRTYELARLIPVPHDLLDFRNGRLQIKDVDEAGRPLSTVHDADPRRYIVHRGHLLTVADNWGGPLRSLVFWWLLGTMSREWWARFLDRYGAPFTVGKYESGDDESRTVMERAFALATKLGGLVITRESEVDLKQAAASDSGDAFAKFHDLCNAEISKLVLGQTLSADAASTGLGSGVANGQEAVRQDIRQFDAMRLGATLSTQLAAQFLQINGIAAAAPIFVWGSVSPAELESYARLLTSLGGAGLRVADAGIEILSERFGLPLERAQGGGGPLLPFSVRTFAARAPDMNEMDIIARRAAADLSRTLGHDFAPIRQIVLASTSPEDCIAKVTAHCAKYDPARATRILEEVLFAYAANGAAVHAH